MIYAYASMISLLLGHIILIHGLQSLDAYELLVIIYAFSTVVIGGLCAFNKDLRKRIFSLNIFDRHSIALMLMMGFNVIMFYMALGFIGLSGIAVFASFTTVTIVLGGVFLFKEPMNVAKILLIVASIISTSLFSFSNTLTETNISGFFLALLASTSWAAIHFQMKRISGYFDSFAFVCARVPFILLLSIPIYLIAHDFKIEWASVTNLSATDFGLLFTASVFMGILTYAFMPLATKHTDLSTIAIINSLRPLLSFFIGIAFFEEASDSLKILAGVIGTTAGIAYSIYTRKKSIPPA